MSIFTNSFSSSDGEYGFAMPVGAVPAIQAFDLRYTDGDHFVSRIGIGPRAPIVPAAGDTRPDQFGIALGGKHRNSPIAGSVRMFDFSGYEGRPLSVLNASCRGISCTSSLPITTLGERSAMVMNGFLLDFGLGNDHQIQRITVRRSGMLGVRTGFGHATATGRFQSNAGYTLLPEWAFRHPPRIHRWRGMFEGSTSARLIRDAADVTLLTGFSFSFRNGVQNLRRISIDLSGDDLVVWYTGNAPGQPAQGVVEYLNWRVPLS